MKKTRLAKAELASAFLIWGTIGIFVKFITLNSGVVAFNRSIVGMIFLIMVKLIMKSRIDFSNLKGHFLELSINGALLGINWILLFESYNYTTVATSTICYNLGPMIVVLVSPLVFKEKLTAVKISCALMALFGVVCVSGVFEQSGVDTKDLIGISLGLSAAVVYAITVIINKRLDDINPMDKAITQFASSTVVMFIYCLFTTDSNELSFTVSTVILLLVVGVVHTGFAYFVYFKSLPYVTSQNVAIFAYIDPVFAVVLSAVVLGEILSISTIVGALLVIVSAIVSELYDNKQKSVIS
ncbi:MAG: DMT family transporter [Ruminococcus sp.]|nr:DMT family transporter [Ruminococcus sp.]